MAISRANVAAQIMEHLCTCPEHGYSQPGRYGTSGYCTVHTDAGNIMVKKGDRDCSSAVCEAWELALKGTPYEGTIDRYNTTWTMKDMFVNSGLFSWHGMSFNASRGDIYLDIENHTAMCIQNDAYGDILGEFSISETGGIDGQPGDQTGWESSIHGYYEAWDGILHYNGKADSGSSPEPSPHVDPPKVSWKIKQDGKWLKENSVGVAGYPVQAIAIDFKGNGWYQVCTVKHGWLERVRGYDTKDDENGYAGYEDSPIIAVRCYYETPEPTDIYYAAKYRASDLGKNWWPYQYDDDVDANQDGYAGDMVPIDRFEISLAAV